ncbi:MAG: cyclic nucleotide-binding domain-containing protein [Variovorax sp.]
MQDTPQPFPAGIDLRERAVELLTAVPPHAGLDAAEARIVVDAMRPVHLLADTLLFEEGDAVDNDYTVLVLEGQVGVQSSTGVEGEAMVISLMGPGSLVGEMGVLDGASRAASCTAITDVKLGVLSRESLLSLIDGHPGVASHLLLRVSQSLSERLREGNRRLRTLSQVSRALRAELDAAHAVNLRLLQAREL